MPLLLHKMTRDGRMLHEPFNQATWEAAMRDASLSSFWGHDAKDCHSPVARFFAERRREGEVLSAAQHDLADVDDPHWVEENSFVRLPHLLREIKLEQSAENVLPPGGPPFEESERSPHPSVDWPPNLPLTPKFLSEMSGLCIEDCKEILRVPWRALAPSKVEPLADVNGQLSLF
jgi:hypothetical protein